MSEHLSQLPSNLKGLISSSESLKVEFKESYAEREEITDTMVAFANAIGGILFIGVKEVSREHGVHIGEVIGVEHPGVDEASQKVHQWAQSLLPRIDVSFRSLTPPSHREHISSTSPIKFDLSI